MCNWQYFQTFNIWHTLVDNTIVGYSDVVGASPVDSVPYGGHVFALANDEPVHWRTYT